MTVMYCHRRGFLIRAGALAMSAALPGLAQSSGKRIGFVDDNLENFHSNVFLQALRGPLKDRGFTVEGCTGLKVSEGKAWAEKNGVKWHDSAEGLNKQVDYFMVLAPSTPETHLQLAQQVLLFKKPTYIDKPFAADLAAAKKIFALADEHGTPLQSSSALRYTNVHEEIQKLGLKVKHAVAWGAGGSFAEYAIHPVELLISIMGPEVTALMRRGTDQFSQLLLNFADSRTAVINVYTRTKTEFGAALTSDRETRHIQVDSSKIFVNNMAALLEFFSSGKPSIDRRETLAIMRVLEAAKDPQALERFVSLPA